MKKFFTAIRIIALTLLISCIAKAQVPYEATVENIVVSGDTVEFDIYLRATDNSQPVYLADADFIFTYNEANFTNPSFSYIDGSYDLVTTLGIPAIIYNFNLVTDESFLSSGLLVTNLQAPTFSDQSQFDSRVAKIDTNSSTHKIGRFELTGISNPSGTLGLQWRTTNPNQTLVLSFENTSPWISSLASGTFIGPPVTLLPVELASFSAAVDRRDIHLSWVTESETNNHGFDIERKSENSVNWLKIDFVEGNGTVTESQTYSYTDRGLNTGKYEYRLKQIDYNGNFEYFNLSNEVEIGVPEKYDISQNYPNPFNPTTKIDFDLPFDSRVSVKVFDITGREISTLVNEVHPAGYYTLTFDGDSFASGMYFYRIVAEGNDQKFIETKKMVLVK